MTLVLSFLSAFNSPSEPPVEAPITFLESNYALLDEAQNAILTTQWGNLAIFTVRSVAEQYAKQSKRRVRVVTVHITPVNGTGVGNG